MSYRIFKDVNGHWRWHLKAANHTIIANSGEAYWNRADCLHAITLVKGSSSTPIYEG